MWVTFWKRYFSLTELCENKFLVLIHILLEVVLTVTLVALMANVGYDFTPTNDDFVHWIVCDTRPQRVECEAYEYILHNVRNIMLGYEKHCHFNYAGIGPLHNNALYLVGVTHHVTFLVKMFRNQDWVFWCMLPSHLILQEDHVIHIMGIKYQDHIDSVRLFFTLYISTRLKDTWRLKQYSFSFQNKSDVWNV